MKYKCKKEQWHCRQPCIVEVHNDWDMPDACIFGGTSVEWEEYDKKEEKLIIETVENGWSCEACVNHVGSNTGMS